jgi:ribonucleoside-diphosphate reductase alpha chain
MASQATAAEQTRYQVIRRNGKSTPFDGHKISVAVTKAFLAVEGNGAQDSSRIHEVVTKLTAQIVNSLTRRLEDSGTVHIEIIQDQVELALMREGEYKVARAYVLYREQQSQKRAKEEKENPTIVSDNTLTITTADGSRIPLDIARLQHLISEACEGVDSVDGAAILRDTQQNLFDGVSQADVEKGLVMAARTFIEKDPGYSTIAARLLMDSIRREALSYVYDTPRHASQTEMAEQYSDYFKHYIHRAIDHELLAPELAQYDLEKLGNALKPENDFSFTYLGLQTLYDR